MILNEDLLENWNVPKFVLLKNKGNKDNSRNTLFYHIPLIVLTNINFTLVTYSLKVEVINVYRPT